MRGAEQQIVWAFIGLSLLIVFLYFSRKNTKQRFEEQKQLALVAKSKMLAATVELSENHKTIHELTFHQQALQSLIDEKSKSFPWLLAAKIEYGDVIALRDASLLARKKHPAIKASEEVGRYRSKARELEILNHRLAYRERYLGKLFPRLNDFLDEDISELLDAADQVEYSTDETLGSGDPALQYLNSVEYQKLNESDRNQLALDRYLNTRKTKWQIGREFERYVGHLLEEDNYNVSYEGAIEGFSDLGRDLIASKKGETLIVQCKFWREDRTIHEKHIYQLYGTFCDFVISNNLQSVAPQGQLFGERDALQNTKPVFWTTGTLSDRAKLAGKLLGVEVRNHPMAKLDYPRIKCNISQRDGSKIYHMPFDQQYDRIRIEKSKGESFERTCKRAEELGFRRAWKWKGSQTA